MAIQQAPAQPLILDRDEIATLLPDVSANGRTVVLVGPVGTGKTQLGIRLADAVGTRVYVFGCTPDSQASELIGSPMPNPDGSGGWLPFVPGPAIRAWTEGAVLVVDDLHRAGPGITSALNIILNGASAQYPLPDGTVAKPSAEFRCVATMNGDITDLDPDTRDRLRIRIPVMTPSTAMLDTLRAEVRELVEADYDGATGDPVNTFREWQSMSDLWGSVGLARACLLALGTVERARKMITALAAIGIPDAQQATVGLVGSMPRGYRP